MSIISMPPAFPRDRIIFYNNGNLHKRPALSHNLRKFPQIYAVSMGVVLVIMRILCILLKSLLLSHSQPPSPYTNKDM